MTACFKKWCLNSEVATFKPLAIIVLWFIWKARNLSCFEDLSLSLGHVSSFSLGMMKNIPQKHYVASIHTILMEVIDKSYACGFFDGSAAAEPIACGAGELRALKLLLTLARRKSLDKVQIFGDS